MRIDHPRNWAIRSHLIAIIAIFGLCMSAWSVSVHGSLERVRKERAIDEVRLLQARIIERHQAISRETRQLLLALSVTEPVQSLDAAAITALLKAIHRDLPHYATLVAASPEGLVFACSIPANLPIDIRERPWFARVMTEKSFVIDEFIFSKSARTASLPYAFPVLDKQGAVRMILGAALNLSFFEELFPPASDHGASAIVLLDHHGHILFATGTTGAMLGRPAGDLLPAPVTAAPGVYQQTGLDGREMLYVVEKVAVGREDNAFTLVVGTPESTLFAESRRQVMVNLATLAATVLFSSLLLFFYGRRVLADPLRMLIAATRKVSAGDLTARTGLSHDSADFGSLAREIDAMIESLGREDRTRQQQEQQLRESEQRFKTLIDNAADAIYLADLSGRILDVNSESVRQTGFDREELLAMTVAEVDASLSQEEWIAFTGTIPNLKTTTLETRHRRKDGSVFPVEVRVVFLRWMDQPMVLGTARDVTERRIAEEERKRLQVQLNHSQKMEAIGTLAGGIAHDFNNILGAVLGYAEMAREAISPETKAARHLDRVLSAGRRAADLVRQILAFSRQAEAEHILLDPARMVREAVKLLRPTIPATITITTHLEDTGPILADPIHLHQIVMNLCTNAFHAMEQTGGRLAIRLGECRLSRADLVLHPTVQPGRFVRLAVADTGPGIAPEIREKIFDPYFTTKGVGKGTGMGLAIVHGIVTTAGGFVLCESELGQGTVFRVCWPVAEEDITPVAEAAEQVPVGRERVLLVDDETMLVEMGQLMLAQLGYEVTACTGSLEALHMFQSHPDRFDVVLTDLTMPHLTGLDLARGIRAIRPDIPIILCSGYSAPVDEEEAKSCGIHGFAAKPLTRKQVALLLRQVLDAGT